MDSSPFRFIKSQIFLSEVLRHRKERFVSVITALLLMACFLCVIGGCGKSELSPDIPEGTKPCEHPEYWPYRMESKKNPFIVHYRTLEEAETAKKVIEYLDNAWEFEVNELGFRPPPSDEGCCGPDDRFDVFIWRGFRKCEVNIISEKIVTSWGARTSFMTLDPWGPYGGEKLSQTVAHEFNHACHAMDDWHEAGDVFEMTATYIEQYFGDACADCISDFQAHPDWGLLWYDDYKTWYMYGSALYLYFLKDYYFPTDKGFPERLWRNVRNIPDPFVNKPNLVDGLDALLVPVGSSFIDSAILFARWRYYAGSRDDGRHFQRWPTVLQYKQLPFMAETDIELRPSADIKLHASIVLTDTVYKVDPPPMLLGSAYIEILQDQPGQTSFEVSLETATNPDLRWVVQAVPGIVAGSDGDTIDLISGSARVPFSTEGKRTLIITLIPVNTFDPNQQTGETFPVAIHLAP
jgi:hypothetical protein